MNNYAERQQMQFPVSNKDAVQQRFKQVVSSNTIFPSNACKSKDETVKRDHSQSAQLEATVPNTVLHQRKDFHPRSTPAWISRTSVCRSTQPVSYTADGHAYEGLRLSELLQIFFATQLLGAEIHQNGKLDSTWKFD